MRITVRLNSPYDIDLISLLYRDDYDLKKAMRNALYAYVRGEEKQIPVPDSFVEVDYLHRNPHLLDITIYDQDRDVIGFYESIRYSYRNSFLKHIFRHMAKRIYIVPEDENAQIPVKTGKDKTVRREFAAGDVKDAALSDKNKNGFSVNNPEAEPDKASKYVRSGKNKNVFAVDNSETDNKNKETNEETQTETLQADDPASLLKELF